MSVYDRELLAVVHAVTRWSQYLLGQKFVIRTDQRALKFLMEQKVHTNSQLMWLTKLMPFDYTIEYKKGSDNKVVDALSRVTGSELLVLAVSTTSSELLQAITQSWNSDPDVKFMKEQLKTDPTRTSQFTWTNGQLRRRGRLVVGRVPQLRRDIMAFWHASAGGGHSGVEATLRRLLTSFYWKGLRKDVHKFAQECDIYQRNKPDIAAYLGLLQPLPIPEVVWSQISMDFIDSLPKSNGFEVILVVVDRLSKYAHFLPLKHPYTPKLVASAVLNEVVRLHSLPDSIVSDRDVVFLSSFWQELFTLQGVQLNTSSVPITLNLMAKLRL